jgi:hypothetical protein
MHRYNTDLPAEVVGMYVLGILPGFASYRVEPACTISLGSIDIWKTNQYIVSLGVSYICYFEFLKFYWTAKNDISVTPVLTLRPDYCDQESSLCNYNFQHILK